MIKYLVTPLIILSIVKKGSSFVLLVLFCNNNDVK